MLLLIDNYDSFVFNLARYFERLGQPTRVVRNDAASVEEIRSWSPSAIVLSPGPCTPNEAGVSLDVVRALHEQVPMLGVCLGHQAIAAALGARVVRAVQPMHGRASAVMHGGTRLFADVPNPMTAGRYHSLVVEEHSLPMSLKATARAADGALMAFEHTAYPVFGVQFHPESILTESGYPVLANFLRLARLPVKEPVPTRHDEHVEPSGELSPLPEAPVTF